MAKVKICGLSTEETIDAALRAGVDWIGFVHFEKSPRHISLDRAAELATYARRNSDSVQLVALMVSATPEFVTEVQNAWAPDVLQFHGEETNDTIETIRTAYPETDAWKVLSIASSDDVQKTRAFPAATAFLFDAKPPKDADRPGGWGETFDWTLIGSAGMSKPWLLAGGLTPENVADAISISGARAVDVSSGVERAVGVKDPDKITAFIKAAKAA